MKKTTYYIESGALREVVQAENPDQAFKCAFMRALEKETPVLSMLTLCSVHGFLDPDVSREDMHDDDLFVSTEYMLKITGLIKYFSQEELEVQEPEEGDEWKKGLDKS